MYHWGQSPFALEMYHWGQSPFALEMYHWGQSPYALVEVSDCRLTNQVTKGDRPQWHIEKACELDVSNGQRPLPGLEGQQAE